MRRMLVCLTLLGVILLSACSRKDATQAPATSAEPLSSGTQASLPAEPAAGPQVVIHMRNGSKVPGIIVASSRTDMVVAGDSGIEHKIPLGQVKSVEYVSTESTQSARPPARESAPSTAPQQKVTASERKGIEPTPPQPTERATGVPAATSSRPTPAVTTRTFELPAGSGVSVRTNEVIDSETATEGQTFDSQVTRDAKDANRDIVIPRGSDARVVIKSTSKGGRFRGASDLVLDLQSVTINGTQHTIDTSDVTKQGKSGVGANRRTAEYTGGGAAVGAIIGAIAGGGKGAAIGAGAGAGAGALTQILTKGRAIKVPAESVLTFNLDRPLKVAQLNSRE